MGLGKFIVSAISELLIIPSIDPYKRRYQSPRIIKSSVDAKGRPVIEVFAMNQRDATRPLAGNASLGEAQVNYPGDVSWVATHVGKDRWVLHVEDWDWDFTDKDC